MTPVPPRPVRPPLPLPAAPLPDDVQHLLQQHDCALPAYLDAQLLRQQAEVRAQWPALWALGAPGAAMPAPATPATPAASAPTGPPPAHPA